LYKRKINAKRVHTATQTFNFHKEKKGTKNILYQMLCLEHREISAIPHVWVAIMLMMPAVL
jgi:hypothetical protein